MTGSLGCGSWTLHWSTGPRAPVSTWEGDGAAALILGDAVDGPNGRLDAERLAARVRSRRDASDLALGGYFLAVVMDGDAAVVVSDLLGLYPVYRGEGADFAASSISLPIPGRKPDPRGLAGVLAFHGTVGGRSIAPGVTRVPAGNALVFAGTRATEHPTFSLPDEESLAGHSVDEQDDLLHEALADALRAQLPDDEPVGLLLTGGRDSRTLAGLLHREGRTAIARTVGLDRDHEAVLARRVADRLGTPHDVRPLPENAFSTGMDVHLATDHLASGATHAYWRGASAAFADLPTRSVTGHLYDVVVGGMMRLSGTREYGMDRPWETARPLERRAGVPDAVMEGLRDHELRAGWDWAEDEMRRDYHASPVPQRLWRWTLAHVCRFHIGMILQPISLETWPVLPVLDRRLIEVAARLDSHSFSNRFGQDRMLRRYYPDLSDIEHTVENASPHTPVRPSLARRVRDRLRPARTRPGAVSWRGDRRFVWRNTDFHNPGWEAIRRLAEPHRDRLHEYFDASVLADYLPPPHGQLTQRDFAANQGPKLLTALALWLDRHST